MTVHLLKLAVGAESLDHMREYTAARVSQSADGSVRITTRMAPKRADELLDGGSLYWVIKGALAARQEILAMEPYRDPSGIQRIGIFLKGEVVAVRPRPCRPFQGWRYLRVDDAPADLPQSAFDETMPPTMRRELMELCLI